MPSLRLTAAVAVTALVGWLAAAAPADAAGILPGPTTTVGAPTTVTTAPPATAAPSTTVAPPATAAPTTAAKHAGSAPATGVPAVPTGGPPTSAPAPGAPPAPQIDLGPSVAAVNTDLAQLAAISSYGRVQAAVGAAEAQLTAAKAGVAAALANAAAVGVEHQIAAGRLAGARNHMAGLALAAYTGEAYANPGAAQALSPTGTVSTAGGITPDVAAEQDVLLGIVVDQTEKVFTSARAVLRDADAASAKARADVAAANAAQAGAIQGVANAKAALVAATRAATVAGAAAQQAAAGAPGASAGGAQLTSATSPTMSEAQAAADAPTILGPSAATGPELAAWFDSTGHQANTTVPIAQLAADYVSAGTATGVRADLAFAQSIVETGFFSFPAGGQLTAADNNFAGIGACDSCAHGWSFPDALTGVTAQEQLLEAYASPTKVATPLVGPVGVGGCCATWVLLAGKWASSKRYGVEILAIYKQILDWVIPQRLLAAGLVPPGSVVPAPPGTEASGPAGPPATTQPAPTTQVAPATSPAPPAAAPATTVPLAPVAGG
ncbi:glucosaminidase domain-containing protein [Acidiferrimicrobium sp. IK]|uniref:glucosaminidase domain-containing protein n=1 Tax=Acidiferrimicrobium sp. IK TaxID=2871700 RepID=UPI0021CB8568|nr:glucosaminidase domain-containing protein [Acidiferrimicrobium sp. IK]MCU4185483.1 glucosaminidase domain-containing protein [Acidiferrimicrobium sp. IK]